MSVCAGKTFTVQCVQRCSFIQICAPPPPKLILRSSEASMIARKLQRSRIRQWGS